ncbi:MAG: hypothetical protein HOO96_22630 [Polyangiaceae bacterium]|nr:hypothetical protein [Polyangiaceae bacterium]
MTPEEILFRPTSERPELGELIAVQTLYIKLLYCEATNAAYRASPTAVLDDCGLPASTATMLPRVESENHRAEMHGRRLLAARELLLEYPTLFATVVGADCDAAMVARQPFFSRFLSSADFFDPKRRLPHAFGIGEGYENVSAFFFWARANLEMDPQAKQALFEDFGRWLVKTAKCSAVPELQRHRRGAFFFRLDGRAMVVTGAGRVIEYAGVGDVASVLRAAGLTGLEDLEP